MIFKDLILGGLVMIFIIEITLAIVLAGLILEWLS